MSKSYPKELRNIVLDMYKSGLSCQKIAIQLNISATTVLNWIPDECKRHAVAPYSKEVINRALDMYKSGLSANNIALKLKLNKKTVLRWIPNNLKRSVKDYDLGNQRNHTFFEYIKSEEQAYFLGLITADGSISKTGCLSIELKSCDCYILETFRNILSPNAKVRFTSRTKIYKGKPVINETNSFTVTCKQYLKDLSKYYIVPNKTYCDIRLPNLTPDLMNHYIRGLFDGDGSIYISGKYKTLLTVSFVGGKLLLEEVAEYLKTTLSLKGSFRVRARKTNCFDFVLTTQEDIHKFKDFIYKDATIFLKRKHTKFYSQIIAT